jgi:Protein of unknown function (DUF3738)
MIDRASDHRGFLPDGRPVVDMTGLQGSYDFALSWSPRARLAQKHPMPVIVIDRLDRTPAEN